MNNLAKPTFALVFVVSLAVLIAGCASAPKQPVGAAAVRAQLTQLQSNQELASRAPVAIKEAEEAVRAAEAPVKKKDKAQGAHLVQLAKSKVEVAIARGEAKLAEDQRKNIGEQRQEMRLEARTQEADAARREAEYLQSQLAELNAKTTERGIIVTLGDVLFETGRSELRGNSTANLSKLTAFLQRYPDRSVTIEGHTDSTGSDDSNMSLSQRRADAVRNYLLTQGVTSSRLSAYGKGESSPVGSNDSTSGRQLNRRVEVIITNPAGTPVKSL